MWVVVVWTMTMDGYEDGVIGPYRSEEKAERKADAIRRAIERADRRDEWDEPGDRPAGVAVTQLIRGDVAARDAVLAHLVHDL